MIDGAPEVESVLTATFSGVNPAAGKSAQNPNPARDSNLQDSDNGIL